MIRSHLLFLGLLFAYICFSPAGIYTCACLVPDEAVQSLHAEWEGFSEQTFLPNVDTAVSNLLAYFSLSFLTISILRQIVRFKYIDTCQPIVKLPIEFIDPPPTPPPHFL